MSIESILEHQHYAFTGSTSLITTAVGSVNAQATNYGNLTIGDLIQYIDDAGAVRYGEVAALPGAPNFTLETAALSVSSGGAGNIISIESSPSCYYFESNNANLKAGLVTIDSADALLSAPTAKDTISANEGILIKSVYLRLPYQYTLADGQIFVNFRYYDSSGVFISNIATVGEEGDFYIPRENYEIPVNSYLPPPTPNQAWRLHCRIQGTVGNTGVAVQDRNYGALISCVNAPNSLNGVIMPVTMGVRIVHAATVLT